MFKRFFMLISLCMLTACVTVKPKEPVKVSGAAGFLTKTELPSNAIATVALIDLDTPGVIVEQKSFAVKRQPILFQFILTPDEINEDINYGLVAMITVDNKVKYQTYKRYPVIHNERFVSEVVMQPVKN